MIADPWHYGRTELAKQVLGMFETGLSTALVFFAPRRMGKTEFLRKDMMPLATNLGWKVFYFSFLDSAQSPATEFAKALNDFADKDGVLNKTNRLLGRVSKVTGGAVGIKGGIEFDNTHHENKSIKEIFGQIAAKNKVILLMDEVQALTQNPGNTNFIAALRTSLDIYKDSVKVIFTGSSQEGLRRMFSEVKAPFFHFGQNLPFPELDQGFTDHLVGMFSLVTKRVLNKADLWDAFQEMQKIPQLGRALVERLALNPTLTLNEAKKQLLRDVYDGRAFAEQWERSSVLEKILLNEIANDRGELFSVERRKQFSQMIGILNVSASTIQSALKLLQRKGLIGQPPERGDYFIDDPNFKSWLLQEG